MNHSKKNEPPQSANFEGEMIRTILNSRRHYTLHPSGLQRQVDETTKLIKKMGKKKQDKPLKKKVGSVCSGWSLASMARFKLRVMAFQIPSDWVIFGFTFTYPKVFPSAKDSKADFHELFKNAKRDLPCEFFALWKLELQKRGAPHFHTEFACPASQKDQVQAYFWFLWIRLVGASSRGLNIQDKYIRGVTEKYIAKHHKKSNQMVVGECGRVWGIVNRSVYKRFIDPTPLDFTAPVCGWLERALRRYVGRILLSDSKSGFLFYTTTQKQTLYRLIKWAENLPLTSTQVSSRPNPLLNAVECPLPF
jgi:hypothetical protein